MSCIKLRLVIIIVNNVKFVWLFVDSADYPGFTANDSLDSLGTKWWLLYYLNCKYERASMVQKYQSPVRVYKYPFELVMAVSIARKTVSCIKSFVAYAAMIYFCDHITYMLLFPLLWGRPYEVENFCERMLDMCLYLYCLISCITFLLFSPN